MLTAAVLPGAIGACRRAEVGPAPPTPVRTEIAEPASLRNSLSYAATIQPRSQVGLAFKVNGYVTEILQVPGPQGQPRDVQEGDAITAGTVLARVRQLDYSMDASRAHAQLRRPKRTASGPWRTGGTPKRGGLTRRRKSRTPRPDARAPPPSSYRRRPRSTRPCVILSAPRTSTTPRVAQLHRDVAREKLRVVTNQYREQAALLPDVLAAQAALGQASDQYRQAVLSFWEARADFERALGAE